MRRARRRGGWAVLAIALTLVLALPSVSAHAYLDTASPRPNARLVGPPTEAVLVFTERIEAGYSSANVTNATGVDQASGPATVPSDQPATLVLPLGHLDPGPYRVYWSVLSVDGHRTSGTYPFTVSSEGTVAPSPAAAGGAHSHGPFGQAMQLGGLLAALGMLFFAARIVPGRRAWSDEPRRSIVDAAGAICWLAVVGGLFVFGDEATAAGGSFFAFSLGTWPGRFLATRLVGLGVAGALLLLRPSKSDVALRVRVASGFLALAILATTATSHAAALVNGRWMAMPLDVIHMGAASVWLGGLVGLAVWLPKRGAGEFGEAIAAFSPWAMGSVAVLVVAGTLGALFHLKAVSDLWDSTYGAALLTKVGCVAALVVFGYVNRFVLGRRLREGADRRRAFSTSVGLEVALMAVVLVATAVLTESAPPVDVRTVTEAPIPTPSGGPTNSTMTAPPTTSSSAQRLLEPGVIGD